MAFGETLGPELRIFETTLGDDDKIHITRFMPHMVEYPIFVAGSNEPRTPLSSAPAAFNCTLSVNVAADGRPYVEECFLRDMLRGVGGNHDSELSLSPGRKQCSTCGSDKKKAASGSTSEALLTCTRCKVAKYCSKECQKADWKEHKALCAPL